MKKLIEEFESLNSEEALKFIQLYEENKITLDVSNFKLEDPFRAEKIKLFCNYSLALINKGQLSKGLKKLKKGILIYEKHPNSKGIILQEDVFYEQILWVLGKTQFDKKQIKESTDTFKKLNTIFPENEYYSNWNKFFKTRKIRKFTINPLWILAGGFMVAYYFLLSFINESFHTFIAYGGLGILLIVGVLELYIYKLNNYANHKTRT